MTLIVASATTTATCVETKQQQNQRKKETIFIMISKSLEVICCALFVLSIASFCSARPPQGFNDQPTQGVGELEPSRNLLDTSDDLTALKMQLLAQQFAEYNGLQPLGPAPGLSDRFVLSKRQQRYRQCYFNPISCFRK